MRSLKRTILEGWPDTRAKCDPSIVEFFNHRDELSYEDRLIFRGQALIIPKPLRADMLTQVHKGHLGVTKTLERARDSLFWPGMCKQVTEYVLDCPTCLAHRDSNAKEPMIATEFPDRPFQKIGADLFHFDGKEYLLTIDYYSKHFEVDLLRDTKSATVIQKLRTHMSRYGICDILVSDNGPQFASQEFRDFAEEWSFKHETSSPFHPKGNGMAEKGVGIAKKLMKKARDTKQSPYALLLEYRNTPLDCGYSPSQLLLGRRTKAFVPISPKALQPTKIDQRKLKETVAISKGKQKQHYDRSAKELKPLNVNDSARVQFGKIWKPAKILDRLGDRSYTVQTRDGGIYRRNRRHLIQTRENLSDIFPLDINILDDNTPPSIPSNEISLDLDKGRTGDKPYVTRCGRVVKENRRFKGPEWSS